MTSPHHLIAISVGNTRTQVGHFIDGALQGSQRFSNEAPQDIVRHVRQEPGLDPGAESSQESSSGAKPQATIMLASVNDAVSGALIKSLKGEFGIDVYRVGEDVAIPIGQQLDPETVTGVDRLLNAAAAYETLKQACVVVDTGTAITIDFVDGEGTFHGGAIAPGASMQLKSLHERTAALPDLAFRAPEVEPFGRNTAQAMYQGVFHGIRGMLQRLVEQYAESYGAYPMVIATGGDAQVLFEGEPMVDRIVPDLTLRGIEVAARYALEQADSPLQDDRD